MPTYNVKLTDELARFVRERVEDGRFGNASEVVSAELRSLYREERQHEVKLANLRAQIDKGDASGIAEENVFDRLREKHNLSRTSR